MCRKDRCDDGSNRRGDRIANSFECSIIIITKFFGVSFPNANARNSIEFSSFGRRDGVIRMNASLWESASTITHNLFLRFFIACVLPFVYPFFSSLLLSLHLGRRLLVRRGATKRGEARRARVNDIMRDFGTWKILFLTTECAENRTNEAEEESVRDNASRANNCVYLAR